MLGRWIIGIGRVNMDEANGLMLDRTTWKVFKRVRI